MYIRKKDFTYCLIIVALCMFLSIIFVFYHNLAVKADEYINKAVGETFERYGLKYRVISTETNKSSGQVQVIGTSKPLMSVDIQSSVKEPTNHEEFEIVSIAPRAFRKNKDIKSFCLVYDSDISEIPKDCFIGCKKLDKVILYNRSLRNIGKNAFNGCKKMRVILFYSNKIKQNSIGKNAFKGVKKGMFVIHPGNKTSKYAEYISKRGAIDPQYRKGDTYLYAY